MHPWVMRTQFWSKEEPHLFPRGDNNKIAEIHWQNIKIFFSRTTGVISFKLGTMHPWVKGIHVCWNEGPHPFTSGDNSQNVKLYWKYLKIFFRTTGPIQPNLAQSILGWREFKFYQIKGHALFQREIKAKNVNFYSKYLKIFSRTAWPIWTKLGTKHP